MSNIIFELLLRKTPDRELKSLEEKLNKLVERKYDYFQKISNVPKIAKIIESCQGKELYTDGKEKHEVINQDFEISAMITDKRVVIGEVRKWEAERAKLTSDIEYKILTLERWKLDRKIKEQSKIVTEILAYKFFEFIENFVASAKISGKSLIFQLRQTKD